MKKLLFLILLIFLFSCEKEKCKGCLTTVTQTGGFAYKPATYSKVISTMTFEACGEYLQSVENQVITVNSDDCVITTKTVCN